MILNSIHGITIEEALGSRIWSTDGREFIDFTTGIFAANCGHNPLSISKDIAEQVFKCTHSYTFATEIRKRYVKALCEFTGWPACALFSSGTEAVEAAWRLAQMHTGRAGIINLYPDAFHGKTLGARIAAGTEVDWRNQTHGDRAAAIILEPYVAYSAQMHSEGKIKRIKDLRREFDLMLIADEIQGGYGRTGKLFGYEHYPGLDPWMVCIGKGMGNGWSLSGLLGPAEILDDPGMDLTSTNGGNPVACAAGLATIEYFQKHDLIAAAERKGKLLAAYLQDMPDAVTVNSIGLVAGLGFKDVFQADAVVTECCRRGLLVVHTRREWVKLGPALAITIEDLEKGCHILNEAVEHVLNES